MGSVVGAGDVLGAVTPSGRVTPCVVDCGTYAVVGGRVGALDTIRLHVFSISWPSAPSEIKDEKTLLFWNHELF